MGHPVFASFVLWRDVGSRRPVPYELGGGNGVASVGGRGGAEVATSVTLGEAVDIDALQLLADVGKLGVGTVGRGLGPAKRIRIASS